MFWNDEHYRMQNDLALSFTNSNLGYHPVIDISSLFRFIVLMWLIITTPWT
jgi:hypothetical protein